MMGFARLRRSVLIGVTMVLFVAGCGRGTGSQEGTDASSAPVQQGLGPLQAQALAESAEVAGISNPPQVDVVAETSPFDVNEKVTECLGAVGYEVDFESGGLHHHASVDNPTDEYWQQFNLAFYVCQAQYPLAEIYYQPLNSEQREAYADYYLEELPACLTEHGVAFETPPSREVFLAEFDTQLWNPYATADAPGVDWIALDRDCPQAIPPELVWSDK